MRSVILALLLLTPTLSFAATKTDPADFTIMVHVVSSASLYFPVGQVGSTYEQVLETVIDGKPVQLTADSRGVLALGDYRARKATKIFVPRNPNTYDIYQGYDLLMPDGTFRTYIITRLGPAVPNP